MTGLEKDANKIVVESIRDIEQRDDVPWFENICQETEKRGLEDRSAASRSMEWMFQYRLIDTRAVTLPSGHVVEGRYFTDIGREYFSRYLSFARRLSAPT